MDFKKHNTISLLTAFMLAMMFIYSCSPLDLDFTSTPAPGRTEEQSATRVPVEDYENVFIVYSMGYNDLDNFLRDDINELLTSPLPHGAAVQPLPPTKTKGHGFPCPEVLAENHIQIFHIAIVYRCDSDSRKMLKINNVIINHIDFVILFIKKRNAVFIDSYIRLSHFDIARHNCMLKQIPQVISVKYALNNAQRCI